MDQNGSSRHGRSRSYPDPHDHDSRPGQSDRAGRSPGQGGDTQIQDRSAPAIRGRVKLALIRDLAMGEHAYATLAQRYGLTHDQVQDFSHTYADEIGEVSQALSGHLQLETAGLWVAKKNERLAEYQQEIEDITQAINDLRDAGIPWSRAHRDMIRTRLDIYRQAADELGAYPQRQQAPQRQGAQVHYVIETDTPQETQDLT